MVHVGVGDEDGLLSGVEVWHEAAEQREHLWPVAGVAAVDEQHVFAVRQDGRVAAAG